VFIFEYIYVHAWSYKLVYYIISCHVIGKKKKKTIKTITNFHISLMWHAIIDCLSLLYKSKTNRRLTRYVRI